MSFSQGMIAGIGPDGLRDPHDIKILICYLLNALHTPLPRKQLAELSTTSGVTDYFSFSDAFEELRKMGHLTQKDDRWQLTPLGVETAVSLQKALPASLREKMVGLGRELLEQLRRDGSIVTRIMPHQNGYHVCCRIQDGPLAFLDLRFFAPDLNHAELIQRRLNQQATDIYLDLMVRLTSPEKEN